MTRFKKIYNWNMSRNLLRNGFVLNTAVKLLTEELNELLLNEQKLPYFKRLWYKVTKGTNTTVEERIDALNDIIVVAVGEIYKLGYDADKTLDETIKEINSRTGSINPNTGKFEKDTSPEAQKKWYKARYYKCKLGYRYE